MKNFYVSNVVLDEVQEIIIVQVSKRTFVFKLWNIEFFFSNSCQRVRGTTFKCEFLEEPQIVKVRAPS